MTLPKVKIKKILYATDLSDSARYAFAYAVNLAETYDAGITILHVLPETPHFTDAHVVGYIGEKRWEEIKKEHFDQARQALIGKRRDNVAIQEVLDTFRDTVQSELGKGFVTDEIVVKRGNPVEHILHVAQDRNCDLIVMGTHGIGSLADMMIGSTARRVVRRSKIPVMVVRLPEK